MFVCIEHGYRRKIKFFKMCFPSLLQQSRASKCERNTQFYCIKQNFKQYLLNFKLHINSKAKS